MTPDSQQDTARLDLDAVIFDFDGTIVDSFHATYATFEAYFHALKKPFMAEDEFRQKFTGDWKAFIEESETYHLKVPISSARNVYSQALSRANLIPRVKEAIIKLKNQRIKLAIVSTSIRKVIAEKLAQNNLDVDLIISGYDLNISDKFALLSLALKKLEVDPKRCIFIGDMEEDISAGKRMGVKTLALAMGFHPYERLKTLNPDAILTESTHIYETIEELAQK